MINGSDKCILTLIDVSLLSENPVIFHDINFFAVLSKTEVALSNQIITHGKLLQILTLSLKGETGTVLCYYNTACGALSHHVTSQPPVRQARAMRYRCGVREITGGLGKFDETHAARGISHRRETHARRECGPALVH